MRQTKKLWMLFAILAIIGGACMITCYGSEDDNPVVSPTDDSSQFVTLSEAVPDAILEIRYYSTGGTFDWFGPESHPDFCGNPETGKYTADNSKSPA